MTRDGMARPPVFTVSGRHRQVSATKPPSDVISDILGHRCKEVTGPVATDVGSLRLNRIILEILSHFNSQLTLRVRPHFSFLGDGDIFALGYICSLENSKHYTITITLNKLVIVCQFDQPSQKMFHGAVSFETRVHLFDNT